MFSQQFPPSQPRRPSVTPSCTSTARSGDGHGQQRKRQKGAFASLTAENVVGLQRHLVVLSSNNTQARVQTGTRLLIPRLHVSCWSSMEAVSQIAEARRRNHDLGCFFASTAVAAVDMVVGQLERGGWVQPR